MVGVMQQHGCEVRDAEALREHYVRILRRWGGNLERRAADDSGSGLSATDALWLAGP